MSWGDGWGGGGIKDEERKQEEREWS